MRPKAPVKLAECDYCGVEFELKRREQRDVFFCSRGCSIRYSCGPVDCEGHGPQAKSLRGKCIRCIQDKKEKEVDCEVHGVTKVLGNGRCALCHNREINKPIDCLVHGAQEVSFGGLCTHCLHHSIVCKIHGPQDRSIAGHCIICKNLRVNAPIDCPVHGLIERPFGGQCPECQTLICVEHGEVKGPICYVCLHREVICGVHGVAPGFSGVCRECKPGSIKQSNWGNDYCPTHGLEDFVLKVDGAYSCWICVKEEFRARYKVVLELEDSFWQLTYRANADDGSGQFMLEKELVELGVGWLVYIKGYINPTTSAWIPLVIGKTGSQLVQRSGTDIRFRVDGDQPARIFLREEGLAWDTSKVLLIPCETEPEAYRLEKELADRYDLFFS